MLTMLRRVLGSCRGRVHVDVDSAAVVYSGSAPAQLPHQLLDRLDVLILADGRYHLHRVQAAGCPLPPGLTLDTGVGNHLPFPSGVILHRIGVVGTAYMNSRRMKMSGNDSGRRAPGDARHFDLNTEVLISQAGSPPRRFTADLCPAPIVVQSPQTRCVHLRTSLPTGRDLSEQFS